MSEALLTWVVFLPLASVVGLALLHGSLVAFGLSRGLPDVLWRWLALAATVVTFGMSVALAAGYDATDTAFQFVAHRPWLPRWGIHYFVGLDGVGLAMLLLTTFLVPLVLIGSWTGYSRRKGYLMHVLVLETGALGAFASLNLFQFYVFFEALLVPMVFLIGVFGGPLRVRAAIKFFLFTLAGSVLFLVALLVLAVLQQQQFGGVNFDLVAVSGIPLPPILETRVPTVQAPWWQQQTWLFAACALAFAVKIPLVPLHTWLPDAHVEAPTGGSVLLAGVLLKLGAFGFVRVALPLFPVAAQQFAPVLAVVALVGILYGALLAMVQSDLKKLVAYTSISHLGFVVLGLFALNVEGLQGGILQMVNHGLSTGALFLLVGMIAERRDTREIAAFGGVAKPMPVFALFLVLITMSSIGVPMLNGFVGEFLVLLGAFERSAAVGAAATVGVVLAAIVMLSMLRRVLFGPVENPENRGLIDLDRRERAVLVAFVIPIVWIGVHPATLLRRVEPSILELLRVMDVRARASAAESEASASESSGSEAPEADGSSATVPGAAGQRARWLAAATAPAGRPEPAR